MSAQAAVEANAQQAPPLSGPPTYQPTASQIFLRDELCSYYGLEKSQISFTNSIDDPILDFYAQFAIVNALGGFQAVAVEPSSVDPDRGYCTSDCLIVMPNGHTRKIFGSAFVGETLHDGTSIATMQQALEVSRGRALRGGLRAVSFDPIKAHRASKSEPGAVATGSDLSVPPAVAGGSRLECSRCHYPYQDCRCNVQVALDTPPDPRRAMEAECHILGKKLSLIEDSPHRDDFGNKTHWRWLLNKFFGKSSMAELTDLEQTQLRNTLRSMEKQFDAAQTRERSGH